MFSAASGLDWTGEFLSVEVTEVQVNLCDNAEDRLKAYCAVIFDNCFVVHNVRVIEKADGLLVAMPSRKVTQKCNSCGFKNAVDSVYCSNCGKRVPRDTRGDSKIHFDIAHPINAECRKMIEESVIAAYEQQVSGS
ncbi:MAG: SpoVG family protein [Pirellulaceae bacterium]